MLGTLLPDQHVYIYGAGFAGLSLAYRLKQKNIPFTLYEKEKIGGKINSRMTDYGPIEAAASTLYMNADAEKFLQELNLPGISAKKKLKRWIWKEEGIISPFNLRLISHLLLNLTKSFPSIRDDSSVEDIFLPLLGQKYIDDLLSPALQGIHAAEAKDLHFLSIFPFAQGKVFKNYFNFFKALKNNQKKEAALKMKGSVSFSGGMQTLIDRLHQVVIQHIQPLPAEFELRPNTVICTSAPDAAQMLQKYAPAIANELNSISYRPISSLTFFSKDNLIDLKNSFGMLIPQRFGSSILGIIHQSEIFPQNYSANCYSVVCKGIVNEAYVLNELKKKLRGFQESAVLESSLTSWKAGLPLYDRNRYKAILNLERLLQERPGLMLFGNYTKGISLRSMISQTSKLANEN